MGGNTGNLRTQRNQSSCNGFKTLGSIIASDAGNGAGSIARMSKWYAAKGSGYQTNSFYNNVLKIKRGSVKGNGNYNNWMNSNLKR